MKDTRTENPMSIKKLARQGDLLFVKIDKKSIPENAKPVDNNVLALGEVTGHSHRAEGALVMEQPSGQKFVYAKNGWTVVHDEHDPINLSKGVWEVRRQQEYEPEGVRMVAD